MPTWSLKVRIGAFSQVPDAHAASRLAGRAAAPAQGREAHAGSEDSHGS